MIYNLFRSVLFLLLLILCIDASAQSTRIQCLTVAEFDGSVSIKYAGPSGTDFFKIYRANQIGGTYELIYTSTNGTLNNYLDSEINAASQSYSYYVESFDNGSSTGVSVEIRTILLNTTNFSNGLVQLSWNDPGINPPEDYQVWVKGGSGFFDVHDYSNTNSYIDTIKACQATIYYQIRVETDGCESISSVRGGNFADITPPEPIIPQNASVDLETGRIHLSWLLPSQSSADIRKYQIWIINEDGGSTQFPEAEIYGYENLSINLDPNLVCDTTITFSITAQDSCGNSSVWDEDYFIRTLNMYSPEYNVCNDEVEISWDSIWGWYDLSFEGINIYQREENGEFEIVAQVSSTETSVVLSGFERGVHYDFYIEAFSEGGIRSATSCVKSIVGRKPTVTNYTWLRTASVIQGEVQLSWQVDSIAYIPKYAISRSQDGIDYNFIDTIAGSSDTLHYYTDLSSIYYQSPQYYRIHPFDSCLNMGVESNFAKTIHTKVSSYADGEALIEWTPYELMDSLLYYQVYRVIDTLVYSRPLIEIYPDEELSYVDNYKNVVAPSSKVGYFVEAVGYFHDSMPDSDTARSNTNFLIKLSQVFVPSGFNPQGGVTSIFKPVYTGIKSQNYSFKILNRWGMMIFESDQPLLGWNGKYNEEYVPPGAYVYVLDYETIYGKLKRQSGIFFVL